MTRGTWFGAKLFSRRRARTIDVSWRARAMLRAASAGLGAESQGSTMSATWSPWRLRMTGRTAAANASARFTVEQLGALAGVGQLGVGRQVARAFLDEPG